MEAGIMKNMVVLKNLPSNIVDEAIIVLRTGKKVKKFQKVEQNKKIVNNQAKTQNKEYIIKEAEMLVNNYISKIERKDKKDIFSKEIKIKYKKLKKYSVIVTCICVIQMLFIVF